MPRKSEHSLSFAKGLKTIERGDVLVPSLRAYFNSPERRDLTIKIAGMGERAPDYWFHPSTHPMWPERALWLWLVAPDLLDAEQRDHSATLAMTVGTIWHAIIQDALMKLGLIEEDEYKVKDEATRTRGSVDARREDELLEIKTGGARKVSGISTVEDLCAAFPSYEVQANEYLRMSGFQRMRFLFLVPIYPFDMLELVLPFNEQLASNVSRKYARVIQAVTDGQPPECSGCPPKTHCPARMVCQTVTNQQMVEMCAMRAS